MPEDITLAEAAADLVNAKVDLINTKNQMVDYFTGRGQFNFVAPDGTVVPVPTPAALKALASSIERYGTVAERNASSPTTGQLALVFANNGAADDPANGIYQWTGTEWEKASWYFSEVVDVAQPLLSAAQEAAVQSQSGADAAIVAAAAAEAAAGPTYKGPTAIADGLAATLESKSFAVDNGNGTVTIYLKQAGVAVKQRNVLTVEYIGSPAGADDLGLARKDDLASPEPDKGAGIVWWMQSGIGARVRTILARLRDDVFVTDYDVRGDGNYDDAPGIRACIADHPGKRIFFPNPRQQYTLCSPLGELPTGTVLSGAGHRTCKLARGYSAADYLMTMGESVALKNLWIDGDSANHTGGGVSLKLGTGRQIGRDLRIVNFAGGTPLRFPCTGASSAQMSGSQSEWDNLEAWRADSSAGLGRYAVVHDDPGVNTGGHPISMKHFNSSGYESIDFGPCNNWYVSNSNLFTFKTNERGVGVNISSTRISEGVGGAYPITLTGAGSMTGVHCFPHLIFSDQPGNAWSFVGGYTNSGHTDNNPNSTTNIYDRTLNSYVPVWKAGATPITIGAGSSTGTWQRHGTLITFNARLIIGADTVLPAGNITVSLPSKCHAEISAQCIVSGHITRGGAFIKFAGRIVSGELVARLERDTSGPITSTSPGALATGDVIQIGGLYTR